MSVDLSMVSGEACMKTIKHLDSLGIRFAGTKSERKGAKWIKKRYRELGLKRLELQEFPCLTFDYSRATLMVNENGRWQAVGVEPAAHSLSTAEGGTEGELVFVEVIPGRASQCNALMRDKIILVAGSEWFEPGSFRRVMASRPRGILTVDDRLPMDWTVAFGFPRHWIDLISCPVLNISYMDAWELARRQIKRVHIEVNASVSEAMSQNVIGEIRGRQLPKEVIIVSGHHDSVMNNPGADDNCTGVAVVLELARLFAQTKPRRTLRFISYGAEEQLSEGAKYYALNAADRDQIQMVLNADAIGAWMGQTKIHLTGPPALEKMINQISRKQHYPVKISREISPFSDHFPLNCFGVPSIWYYRPTYSAARHFHHSVLETPEVVSPAVLARTLTHQAAVLDLVANQKKLPFPRSIPSGQMKELKKMGKQWAGIE
jgi:hypothetical protein